MSRLSNFIPIILAILIAIILPIYSLFIYIPKADQLFIINPSQPSSVVARELKQRKVIFNAQFGTIYAKLLQLGGKYLQPGEYRIDADDNMYKIYKKFIYAKRVKRTITIIEGQTVKQIIAQLNDTYGLTGSVVGNIAEGTLLPDTFNYYYGDTKDSIISRMQRHMIQYLKTLPTFLDQRTLLTIASLVEKEAKLDAERPLVAAVYLNRINIGMPLQADPTIVYGISEGFGTLGRKVTSADLKVDNPYNTYLYKGLPPTPIANPGKEAIKATVFPASVDYLFFVSDGVTGGHKFSNNYLDHMRNVQLLKKRQGLQ